jgi:hypothetical protein
MRWGLLAPTTKLRECPWKKLYIQVLLICKVPSNVFIFIFISNVSIFIYFFWSAREEG